MWQGMAALAHAVEQIRVLARRVLRRGPTGVGLPAENQASRDRLLARPSLQSKIDQLALDVAASHAFQVALYHICPLRS